MADKVKRKDAIDQLVEAAQALGYWSTLRETSQETIDYWTERKDRYTEMLKERRASIIEQGRKVLNEVHEITDADKQEAWVRIQNHAPLVYPESDTVLLEEIACAKRVVREFIEWALESLEEK